MLLLASQMRVKSERGVWVQLLDDSEDALMPLFELGVKQLHGQTQLTFLETESNGESRMEMQAAYAQHAMQLASADDSTPAQPQLPVPFAHSSPQPQRQRLRQPQACAQSRFTPRSEAQAEIRAQALSLGSPSPIRRATPSWTCNL